MTPGRRDRDVARAVARLRLAARLDRAVAGRPTPPPIPTLVVDLDVVTVAGGGLVGSGAAGSDRLPLPWAPPGLALSMLEGAGEVQTPPTGPGAGLLGVGDLVWFRHAKAREVTEHTPVTHLLRGHEMVDPVPTYGGSGNAR